MASFKKEKKTLILNIEKYLKTLESDEINEEKDKEFINNIWRDVFFFLFQYEFNNKDELGFCNDNLKKYKEESVDDNTPCLENILKNMLYLLRNSI